ncbi:MAG TPA: creatininase family protein [Thermoanaerobaculales bacterium]|nr:creatininase family protein [Thermoanaerobaculales bacterium]HQN95490.1 creatininase family protein [Thermoanaerobaculales bacterium]HQP43942.1 creatininase family protein [Thermoanaerobaculales bacterium]
MRTIRMEEMSWPDVRAAIAAGFSTAVVAVGSTEQHGPHLPTMTDTRIGDATAHRFALKLGNALQARTIPVGVSEHHLAFGATISLKPETLKLIVRDYVDSLVRDGFRRIIFLPSHGGNFGPLAEAIADARQAHPEVEIAGYTNLLGVTGFLQRTAADLGISEEACGAHAGDDETSMMMALEPDLVVPGRFEPGYLGPLGEDEVRVIFAEGMPALTENGVLGDPRNATAEKGEVYLEKLASFLVEQVR